MPKNPLSRKQPESYAGKRAIVTGGTSGFGQALVEQLVADGATVLAIDVHEQAAEGALPAGVLYRRLDVRDEEGWDELRNWVEATWGGLDLLINNAGIAVGGRIDVTSLDDWDRIVEINLMGVVKGIRAFVPMMKEQGSGHIVSTASLAGLVHAPGMAAYNVVKAGVVALSETLRYELAPWNIDVSVICPSFFRTNLAESLGGKDVEMEETAVRLITQAPRSAQEVAAKAYDAMQRRRFIILTDQDGVAAYNGKRFSRPVYDRMMLQAGRDGRDGTGNDRLEKLAALQKKLKRRRATRP
ncbi:SDR family NAD(P)-dependent oxidoreductase [Luteipulveratus sp. YIM 133132]|uniref:SDR family NAD(P)-dependent oxidoreductase n=1 Tax=Luteipulveratus flavus TaxID=3031728 RepID=UPI0023AED17F|nr:SDR family NAD(P)-dependent oxidoreductase [Luteipulveratus sp. YIM 133132]MDE9366673.1 SDR family NAD(P)-dependent oxidoreductase [Luteipulveratus sp. YIM 133132]